MNKTIFNVEGMSCQHCVKAITEAVRVLNGVEAVDVSLEAKTVTVSHNDTAIMETIKAEIEDTGYDVKGWSK